MGFTQTILMGNSGYFFSFFYQSFCKLWSIFELLVSCYGLGGREQSNVEEVKG